MTDGCRTVCCKICTYEHGFFLYRTFPFNAGFSYIHYKSNKFNRKYQTKYEVNNAGTYTSMLMKFHTGHIPKTLTAIYCVVFPENTHTGVYTGNGAAVLTINRDPVPLKNL